MVLIAALVDEWFEDIEYFKPIGAFSAAGYKINNVGLRKGKIVQGKQQDKQVDIDASVEDVSVSDFDVLFIPGGYSPDKLRAHKPAVDFAKEFVESGKPVFLICHAPQLLITADILKDRKITGWKSIVQDIKNAGAEFVDQAVVVDSNIISSRGPDDLTEFIKTGLDKIDELRRT